MCSCICVWSKVIACICMCICAYMCTSVPVLCCITCIMLAPDMILNNPSTLNKWRSVGKPFLILKFFYLWIHNTHSHCFNAFLKATALSLCVIVYVCGEKKKNPSRSLIFSLRASTLDSETTGFMTANICTVRWAAWAVNGGTFQKFNIYLSLALLAHRPTISHIIIPLK